MWIMNPNRKPLAQRWLRCIPYRAPTTTVLRRWPGRESLSLHSPPFAVFLRLHSPACCVCPVCPAFLTVLSAVSSCVCAGRRTETTTWSVPPGLLRGTFPPNRGSLCICTTSRTGLRHRWSASARAALVCKPLSSSPLPTCLPAFCLPAYLACLYYLPACWGRATQSQRACVDVCVCGSH